MRIEVDHSTYILACEVFAPEVEYLNIPKQQVFYLPSYLHRHPSDLEKEISDKVTELENMQGTEQIILLYGYCGGGLKTVSPKRVRIVLPLVHDCIPILIGNLETAELLRKEGSFFLSPGWVQYANTPYTEFFEIRSKYDEETAKWVCHEMLKGYRQVVLIDTLGKLHSAHRAYAQSMAALFGLDYHEIQGDINLILKLLSGEKSFPVTHLNPGDKLNLNSLY